MSFTTHQLEAIREGRDRFRCSICGQTWTARPQPSCPGVPVLSSQDPHFKTMTALEAERKYPVDLTKPDAAYRTRTSPYYGWLYDERKCIERPLSAEQIAAAEKRRRTMRARYGCKLCDVWYTKKDQEDFHMGVCLACRGHAQGWNELIAWCREAIEARALVLDLVTSPAERPREHQGAMSPNAYLYTRTYPGEPMRDVLDRYFKLATYQLRGYRALDLATGETVYNIEEIRAERDYQELRYLLTPALSAIASPPAVIAPGRFPLDVAYRALGLDTRPHSYTRSHKSPAELNPALAILYMPGHLYRERAWHSTTPFGQDGRERGVTEREYLAWLCELMSIPKAEDETPGQLARRIILHMAEQAPILIGQEA